MAALRWPGPCSGRVVPESEGRPAASGSAEAVRAAVGRQRARNAAVVAGLALLLAAMVALSLALGRYEVDFGSVAAAVAALANPDAPAAEEAMRHAGVLFTLRLPRVLAALLVGTALSAAGCAYQGIFKNPMVSPDLLGASAGACFGAAVGILLSFGGLGMEISAFACGVIAVAASWGLSSVLARRVGNILVLVLSGLVIGQLFQAFTSAVKFLADPNSQLPEITFWLMGGLSNADEFDVVALAVALAVGLAGLFALRWRINVMALGDEEAASLGVSVKRTRLAVVGFATLLTSASVAVAGMVGWVGLIIPHLARFLVGPDHRVLLPASVLLGGSFLLAVDDVCRCIYTTEIPLSILTAIIGAPLFVYLVWRQRGQR